MSKRLVAFFSASGATAGVARTLSEAIHADIFEIVPKVPYDKGALDHIDRDAQPLRPEIAVKCEGMDEYSVIFVGFPIWWHAAPAIVNTFLESYDLTGKTIVPFATSGGSGLCDTYEKLLPSCKGAKLLEGKRFDSRVSGKELAAWVDDLKI